MADRSITAITGNDLKRIDDFVKLLVGLVVGQFLRDVHQIRDGLRAVVGSAWWGVAEIFPYLLVALVIRNVHASFRYDSWSAARGFSPAYETTIWGRACSFLAGVAALLIATYAVEHFLAHHFVEAASRGAAPEQVVAAVSVPWLVFFLVLPFAIYFIWDLVLWLDTDDENLKKDGVMQEFVKRWLVIDAAGLIWLLLCLLFYIAIGKAADGGMKVTLLAFAVLAAATVTADYIANARFYFGEVKARSEQLGLAEEVPQPPSAFLGEASPGPVPRATDGQSGVNVAKGERGTIESSGVEVDRGPAGSPANA